jgi:hypothetical protein
MNGCPLSRYRMIELALSTTAGLWPKAPNAQRCCEIAQF